MSKVNLTRNEILTLKYLSDRLDHATPPSQLTEQQFYVALKSLKAKDMVYAGFCEGGVVDSSMIKTAGQAALDDVKVIEKGILRQLLSKKGYSLDQYKLLKYAQENDKFSTGDIFAQEHFGIDSYSFRDTIWGQLSREKHIDTKDGIIGMIITRKGNQLLEEIDDELYEILSKGENTASENTLNPQSESRNMQNENALATLLQAKENEIRELKKRLAEYEKPITIEPHVKLRLEAVYKLMEAAGADLNTYGSKTKAAKVAEYLTGIVLSKCKTYLSDRELNRDAHSEEIGNVNQLIKAIGLKCEI